MCVVALAAAFSAVALKKYSPETSAVIAVAAGAIMLIYIFGEMSPLGETVKSLCEAGGVEGASSVLIKTIGICALSGFTADACRDTGNTSLASRIEFASRIAIVVISLPLISSVLDTVRKLLNI